MDFSAALPTFVVTLREGFEAALVVGIVLAYLQKAQQTQLNRWVYTGIVAGIGASALVGLLLTGVLQGLEGSTQLYAPVFQQLLEGVFGVVAIAMLSWMLVWMTQQAKGLKTGVQTALTAVLHTGDRAGWGVFSLIFIAVLREGFETVLFIVAKFQQGIVPVLGALGGLVVAAGLGVLLFKWGVKINLQTFFQVMGVFLLLIVGGLVISALKHFDAAGSLLAQLDPQYAKLCISHNSCFLGPLVWDASGVLPDQEFPGIILKSLFGYRQVLYLGQAIAYLLFLGVVGRFYFRSLTEQSVLSSTSKSPQPE